MSHVRGHSRLCSGGHGKARNYTYGPLVTYLSSVTFSKAWSITTACSLPQLRNQSPSNSSQRMTVATGPQIQGEHAFG